MLNAAQPELFVLLKLSTITFFSLCGGSVALMELRLTLRASKFADAKSGAVSFGRDSAALRGSELAQSVTVSSNCNYNFFAAVINSRSQTRAYNHITLI